MEQEYFPVCPGAVIKKLRKERGLTQSALCGEEIARNMLSQIETGKVNPSLRTMQFLAERLNVPLSLFFLSDTERSALREHECLLLMESALHDGDPTRCLALSEGIEVPSEQTLRLRAEAAYRLGYAAFAVGRLEEAREILEAVRNAAAAPTRFAICAAELLDRIDRLRTEEAGQVLYYGDPADEGQDRVLLTFAQTCVKNGTLVGIAEALNVIEFADRNAKYIALSLIYEARGMNAECRNAQINVKDKELCPDTALWYYRKAEECSACMNDYESAYKLSKKRAQLTERLQKSTQRKEKTD